MSITVADTDTCRGMRAKQLAQLCERFNRLGRESSAIEGAGTGVAITRHLVALMRGQIDVQSQHGVGTTFAVTLSAAIHGLQAARADATPDAAGLLATEPCRIVCIEDNDVNAQLMCAAAAPE